MKLRIAVILTLSVLVMINVVATVELFALNSEKKDLINKYDFQHAKVLQLKKRLQKLKAGFPANDAMLQPAEIEEMISKSSRLDHLEQIETSNTKTLIHQGFRCRVNSIKLLRVTPEELYRALFTLEQNGIQKNIRIVSFKCDQKGQYLDALFDLYQYDLTGHFTSDL